MTGLERGSGFPIPDGFAPVPWVQLRSAPDRAVTATATFPDRIESVTVEVDAEGQRTLLAWLRDTIGQCRVEVFSRRGDGFAPALRLGGYQVQTRGRAGPNVWISSMQDSFVGSGLETSDVGSAGRAEVLAWLLDTGPVSEIHLRDFYGTSGPLLEELTANGWPVVFQRDATPWHVRLEAGDEEHELAAFKLRGRQATTITADDEGTKAALQWLAGVGEVEVIAVKGSDGQTQKVADALGRAGYRVEVSRSTKGRLAPIWGRRSGQIRAAFELRGLGWLHLTLQIGTDKIELVGSYMSSPWVDTVNALRQLLEGTAEVSPAWVYEPGSHRLLMHPAADGMIRLEMIDMPTDVFGDQWDLVQGTSVATRDIVLHDLAAAIASASHALLEQTDPADMKARWNKPLPPEDLEALDSALAPDA